MYRHNGNSKPSLQFECTDHLRAFLKVQDIKTELNDVIISNSIDQILEVIGSNNELLNCVIKYSSKEQLNAIYGILQKEIQKFKMTQISVPIPMPKSKVSHFNTISCESIENICSFLSNDNIKYFKRTSRRISIICLNHMTKYSIYICNATKLLNSQNTKYLSWSGDNTSRNKYKASTTYSSIFEDIEKKYLIPEQHQIPIAIIYRKEHFQINKYQTIPRKSSLIIFDKRNITILNSKNYKKMTNDDIFDYNNSAILTLHYFDIHKQEITMINQLLIDNSVTIKHLDEYIKNVLIKQDNTGKYDKLKELMNINMISIKEMVFNIFSLKNSNIRYQESEKIISWRFPHSKIISLIFQIDSTNLHSLTALKLQSEVNSLERFFLRCLEFVSHKTSYNKKIRIRFLCKNLVELKNNMTDYMETTNTFSEKMQNDLLEAVDKEFHSDAVLSCDENIDVNILKRYISKYLMNGVMPIQYIEIYEGLTLKQPLVGDFRRYSYNNYPQKLYVGVKQFKYNIEIYCESQAPFPFNYHQCTSKEPMIKTKIYIKNEDTVNDVVRELIDHSSSNQLKRSFDEYASSVNPNCYAVITKQFSMIYQSDDNHIISHLTNNNKPIKLFFLPFQNQDRRRNIKLMIRFSWGSCFNSKVDINGLNNKCVGLPLVIFINKNDTLQDILSYNLALQKYKKSVRYIYKVDHDQNNVTSIPQSKRDRYKLWENVLSKNRKNFVVIKIKNRSGFTMYGNQYNLKPCKLVQH